MLETVEVGPADGPCIVLCHGFGADAHDLAPLAEVIRLSAPARWVFPQAPYEFRTPWGSGRAWFPRSPAEIQAFMAADTLQNLAEADPPELAAAAGELLELMSALGAESRRTVIGGFSQGSMVAVESLHRMNPLPAGLLLLSGSIIAEERLTSALSDRAWELRDFPVVQYHGRNDPVLPFESGRRLAQLLEASGAEVSFTPFAGGHGIPPDSYTAIGAAVDRMLGLR